jgi:hypothetical protein
LLGAPFVTVDEKNDTAFYFNETLTEIPNFSILKNILTDEVKNIWDFRHQQILLNLTEQKKKLTDTLQKNRDLELRLRHEKSEVMELKRLQGNKPIPISRKCRIILPENFEKKQEVEEMFLFATFREADIIERCLVGHFKCPLYDIEFNRIWDRLRKRRGRKYDE